MHFFKQKFVNMQPKQQFIPFNNVLNVKINKVVSGNKYLNFVIIYLVNFRQFLRSEMFVKIMLAEN